MKNNKFLVFTFLLCCACTSNTPKRVGPPLDNNDRGKLTFGSILGEDLFSFGKSEKSKGYSHAKVNTFVWNSVLETLNFMPLTSADSASGIIISDWYLNEERPHERIKVTVHFLNNNLKTNCIKLYVHKQVLKKGHWFSQGNDTSLASHLEEIIMKHARNLKANAS